MGSREIYEECAVVPLPLVDMCASNRIQEISWVWLRIWQRMVPFC